MKTLFHFARQAWAGLRVLVLLTVVLGVAYPLAVTGLSQAFLPWQANGSLVTRTGAHTTHAALAVGSTELGQANDDPRWFHPRPSAAGNGYDALASGGSNLGPENATLAQAIRARRQLVAEENGVSPASVPPDALTASASGLDPDISVAYADLQVARVARVNGLPVGTVQALVRAATSQRTLGILGEPRVNVLRLNLAVLRVAG